MQIIITPLLYSHLLSVFNLLLWLTALFVKLDLWQTSGLHLTGLNLAIAMPFPPNSILIN